jgi:ribose transport system permease protein
MASVAERPRRPVRASRGRHFLLQSSPLLLAFAIFLAMLVLYLVLFGVSRAAFPGTFELTSTVNNALPLVFAALGQTLVVLTGGIDLSVGGMMDLTNGLAATHMQASLGSVVLWSVIVLLVGAAGGLLNGLLVAVGRLQPILVTLGTLAVFQGIALKVLPQPGGSIPSGFSSVVANRSWPSGLIVTALAVLGWLALRRSSLGMAIYAIGNDRRAARAHGVDVVRATVLTYVLAGTCVAAGGLLLAATTTGGDATAGDTFTLTSIAATVIGGVSLMGGRGSGIGAIAGAYVLTLLINVLFFAGVNPLYQALWQGVFLVGAVVVAGLVGVGIRRRLG